MRTVDPACENQPKPSEAQVLGLSGSSLLPGTLTYRIDASGYLDLVRATNQEYSLKDNCFAQTITPAMFEFYAMIAYWMRVYEILWYTERDQHCTFKALQQVVPTEFVLPAPLAAWLSGIGLITDPWGRKFQPDFFEPLIAPVHDGFLGGFGTIGPNTVQHYACSLAPYAFAYRMFAENCANEAWVDNHHDFSYPGQMKSGHNGLPNMNLLGYAPLVRPQKDIARQLQRLGINSTAADANQEFVVIADPLPHVRGIPYHTDLLTYISGKLLTCEKMRFHRSLPQNQTGSCAQVGFIECEQWKGNGPYPRNLKLTLGKVTGYSAHKLSSIGVENAIAITKYRINRRSTAENPRPEVFPFSFPGGVPAGWHANINEYFTYGDAATRWNTDDFCLHTINGELISQEFVRQYET